METREIEIRLISDLIPRTNNPRTHSKRQIRQIAKSIERFGFVTPVLVDAEGIIIAGHGRVEAAKSIGMKKVPTLRVTHMSPAQIRAYVIADNKLAENAGWDEDLLALELKELSLDDDFDLTDIGFETAEIDLLLQHKLAESDKADEIPTVEALTMFRSIPTPKIVVPFGNPAWTKAAACASEPPPSAC